ncbi:hypothetical protein MGN70_007228 [Eutypa lata]|uniref:Uncharacterized protein n=1 Tax=Eutypa lata (strain UCR-EL1) TaxID=1287681 RepID=M7SIP4_EUTLA|nr:hypothetical protein UCREL1_8994 [Eutypa lata UCREL1]KAI1250176.1 hypothetical protein MGN70_007228 [Eutypa lata]
MSNSRTFEVITYNPSNANVKRSISVRVMVSNRNGIPQVKVVGLNRQHHVPGKGLLHHSSATTRRDMLVF